MKKLSLILLILSVSNFYSQETTKVMENVKYIYKKEQPFLHYDATKKNLDYLKSLKAESDNKSVLIFYMLSKDSIKILSGGKSIVEDRFPESTTSIRSMQSISNLKSLEILFFREGLAEKIMITPEDLKKYKFIYVSPRQRPIEVEFTNVLKMFW